ncbi:MAG: hypothetical protein EBY29_16375 [Planctomycetes bacterium]|nr:hypothetical protein [Planctomycetota bacterium]
MQHTALSQYGELCAVEQSPANTSPHPPQRIATSATHEASHPTVQHIGLNEQTLSQHDESAHPGAAWGMRQLSTAFLHTGFCAQNVSAAATQDASHVTPQQNASLLHTAVQHETEEHPGAA